MTQFFKRYLNDTRGITAIEYGLIAGVLALGS
jgi:Flp pilus assembly pilin Flp